MMLLPILRTSKKQLVAVAEQEFVLKHDKLQIIFS